MTFDLHVFTVMGYWGRVYCQVSFEKVVRTLLDLLLLGGFTQKSQLFQGVQRFTEPY